MSVKHRLIPAGLGAIALILPSIGRAASLGHPGVSTKPGPGQTKQWTLICDPEYVTDGRITTQYSLNATLSEVDPIGPYQISNVAVELLTTGDKLTYVNFSPNSGGVVTINTGAFGTSVQTGRAQVTFSIAEGQTLPSSSDDDTHLLRFVQTQGSSDPSGTFTDEMVNYGTSQGAPLPDYYSGHYPDPDDPNFTYTTANLTDGGVDPQFTTETATFDIGTPEPSSLALLGAIAMAGLLRRRRKGV